MTPAGRSWKHFPAGHRAVPAGAAGADRAAGGRRHGNSRSPPRLGVCEDTARKWRRRYCEQGLGGLAAPRGRAGRGSSPPGSWPRSRPWPASCPSRAGSRWPAGPARSSPARRPPAESSRQFGRPRCAAGSPTTRSSPGSTGRGSSPATRTSPSRAAASSTFTSGPGRRAPGRGRVRPQRGREARRPGPLAHSPPAPAGPRRASASRASTSAAAPSPTWPPTTSTAPR